MDFVHLHQQNLFTTKLILDMSRKACNMFGVSGSCSLYI